MGRPGSGTRVGVVWAVVFAAGCGSEQFAPPPGLKAVTTSESASLSKTIFMVIPGPPDFDLETYSLAAQREAGVQQAIFRLSGPGPGDPATKQAESIRRAVGDGADALVVLANDEPGTAEALAEAASKGVAVILYGKPVAVKEGNPPFTLVAPEPFAISAKRIVEAAMADAVKNGRPADGEAIIFSSQKGDLFSADRVAALKAAAEAAKCRKVEVVPFDGKPDEALKGIIEMAKAHPDLIMMLGEGDEAMELAVRARRGLKGAPLAFVGGYAGLHGSFSANPFSDESAFVEFRPDNLARLAIRTAVARASGGAGDPVVTLPPKFNRGSGTKSFELMGLPIDPVRMPEPQKKAMTQTVPSK